MDRKTQAIIAGGSGILLGVSLGAVGKLISTKKPELKPVVDGALLWTSGAFVGAGLAFLAAPVIINKSVAASILASD